MNKLACALACLSTAALLAPAPWALSQSAAPADICEAPATLTHVEGRLPQVARMIGDRKLDVMVVGTGSSLLAGPNGARNAYPARLQAALESRLPGVAISVRTDVRPRRTAGDMSKFLGSLPVDTLPMGLVIWQTGTFDAMRSVDPDEFRAVLDEAVARLKARGIDVILMNMQYSPRTESMITAGPYEEVMRLVSQQYDLPLFDRLAIMKYWSENNIFDFSGSDRTQVAERVHDCIGKLLAKTILHAAGLDLKKSKEIR